MTGTLAGQAWLTAPNTAAVLDALEAEGGPGCARFVGGAVRNAVLGVAVDDIDIATTLLPHEVIAGLRAAGIKVVPTGVDHGTVTAVADGRPFEITTLRRDVETDGRRAVVAYTDDWEADAARRDFTLNALYADRKGRIFDPVGTGLADAKAGRIVFVGEPRQRIAEDYLRILRFFRFHAWYGRGEGDPAALEACSAMKGGIGRLAAERISKELLKLLAAPDPKSALMMMALSGVQAEAAPGATNLMRLAKLLRIEGEAALSPDPILRLAALLPDDADEALATAQALRLSNAQRDRLVAALASEPAMRRDADAAEARRAIHAIGAPTFLDRVLLAWASDGPEAPDGWRVQGGVAREWTPPAFPLTGEDALAAGAAKGPAVGEALREVERWWVEADFAPDRAAALEKLRTVLGGAS